MIRTQISIFHLRPPPSSSSSSTLILLHPPEEKYTLDTLPPEWWKAYRLCARFVEAIRTRTVRVSITSQVGRAAPNGERAADGRALLGGDR